MQKMISKNFFKLMNNALLKQLCFLTCEKHRYITLVTTERRRNYLVSEPNYHTSIFLTENLLAIQMKGS